VGAHASRPFNGRPSDVRNGAVLLLSLADVYDPAMLATAGVVLHLAAQFMGQGAQFSVQSKVTGSL
jgi:hypothetical protein